MQEMQELWVWSLGGEDPQEEEMATESSILTREIHQTEEPVGLYSPWGHKESDVIEHNPYSFQQSKTRMPGDLIQENKYNLVVFLQ